MMLLQQQQLLCIVTLSMCVLQLVVPVLQRECASPLYTSGSTTDTATEFDVCFAMLEYLYIAVVHYCCDRRLLLCASKHRDYAAPAAATTNGTTTMIRCHYMQQQSSMLVICFHLVLVMCAAKAFCRQLEFF
jgi:hypothetical protein